MAFTRRLTYAGNGSFTRLRKGAPATLTPSPVNPDRERELVDIYRDAVTQTLADPRLQYSRLVKLLDYPAGHLIVADNFPWEVFETKLREFERTLANQLADGGQAEYQAIASGPFDRRDPNVLLYSARHAADLVTHISEEQRRLLRNLITTAELGGIAPMTLARDIRNAVGLTPKWEGAVTRFHRGMLDKDVDPAFAAKQAKKYRDRLLTARAKMIARTEVMRAQNEGKVVGWKQAIAFGHLSPGGSKQWLTAVTNVCPVCLPMDRKQVGLDDEFTVTQQRRSYQVKVPPAHPHCRCTIMYVPPTVDDLLSPYDVTINDLINDMYEGTYTPDSTPDPEEGTVYEPLQVVNEIADPATDPTPTPADWPTVAQPATLSERQESMRRAYLADELFIDDIAQIPDPPATFTSTRQAEQWMRDNMGSTGIVTSDGYTFSVTPRTIDFEDLTLPLANTMTRTAFAFALQYPRSWARLTGYGTAQALYRTDPELTRLRIPAKTYAQVTNVPNTPSRTLGWNKVWGTKSRLIAYIQSFWTDTMTGWHPTYDNDRFNAVSTTLAHEFTHVIHHRIGDVDPQGWVDRLFDLIAEETGLQESQIDLASPAFIALTRDQVSGYAASSWAEFVAEAFTAYRTQPVSQRTPLIRAVGRWVAHYQSKDLL